MRNAVLMILVVVVALPAWAPARESSAGAVMVITGHPDYPPIMYRAGDRIAGVGADLAEIILTRLDIAFENRFTGPWKRVQETVRHGTADLVVAIYYTRERSSFLEYSAPYCTDPVAVFTSREKSFPVVDRNDLIDHRGVALLGDSFGESLDRFVEAKLRVLRLYSTQEMFEHLLAGRSEYLLQGYYTVVIAAGRIGVSDRITVVRKDLAVENFHFAFSKKSPYVHLLPAFNRQIERLNREGRIERMMNAHLQSYVRGNPE